MNDRIQEIRERQEKVTNSILENGPDKFLKTTLSQTDDIAYLLSEVERLQKSLEWANRIIGSGVDIGAQLRYDPRAWLIEYHSHLKG